MHPMPSEITWLDSRDTVSLPELSRVCGMSIDELVELVDYGALAPLDSKAQADHFSAHYVVQLRIVSKLRIDFDLDVFTAALLMGYLDRIDELERQVRSLYATGSARPDQNLPVEEHASAPHRDDMTGSE